MRSTSSGKRANFGNKRAKCRTKIRKKTKRDESSSDSQVSSYDSDSSRDKDDDICFVCGEFGKDNELWFRCTVCVRGLHHFKALIRNNFSSRHSESANCEDDESKNVIVAVKKCITQDVVVPTSTDLCPLPKEVPNQALQYISKLSLGYVSSFMTKYENYDVEEEELVTNPTVSNKYETLKSNLIKQLSISQEQKLQQLLEHEELGDRKPYQYLRYIKSLAETDIPDSLLLVDVHRQQLIDSVTGLTTAAENGKGGIQAMKSISGTSAYHKLLSRDPEITKPGSDTTSRNTISVPAPDPL
ncbi:unnamed protein product [Acanthoscelides obtectus]|uniref:Uncharacterized protein n=1 Tax=Acanthoscelides obtectus TaxID=200917 RepID=A0A9P0VNR5_ACAOB|nr:unnamed protein product [Acanthoscelides obtectus]CAK1656358.1 hypothetical protein AOBTE_LOCUS19666 [Acanthoscelides obtectus]